MKHDHFEFRHLFHCVTRAFFTKAGVLEAAVGHQIDTPLGAPIDVEVACFRFTGKLHRPLDILGKDTRRQSIDTVVGQGERFFDRIERCY